MKQLNILVVEDERNILKVIKAYLEKEGYTIFTAEDGEKALEIFNNEEIHLIILDLMLPKLSGEKVCTTIRSKSNIPIIMLTAKVEEDNKIEGLSIGADDYVTKPFSPRELVSRVKALIRRSYNSSSPLAEKLVFNNGNLEIDINKMIVKKKKRNVELTSNEFKVLTALLTKPGQVFSREQLIEMAFGYEYEGFDRTIDTHIKNIRQKIEDDAKNPTYIITVYGVGYKFGGI
ncbi:response regulator transcription factor [Schnuerera sp. xch1]|uniref:response regulator transcription factor n=1 Tax=Schnuerera sp. xch1 TaxID=2874283 RepID=UPI001CC06C9F|nr:response regulator transcription factor [Schnuerera sp. xch1]MBZ2175550.1 response regulator transcription factor [Schnuerera sp. xch1]